MRIKRIVDGLSTRSRLYFGKGMFDWFEFDSAITQTYRIGKQALVFTLDGKTYVLSDEWPVKICQVRITEIGWPGRRM